jgi:hypothetical protein
MSRHATAVRIARYLRELGYHAEPWAGEAITRVYIHTESSTKVGLLKPHGWITVIGERNYLRPFDCLKEVTGTEYTRITRIAEAVCHSSNIQTKFDREISEPEETLVVRKKPKMGSSWFTTTA